MEHFSAAVVLVLASSVFPPCVWAHDYWLEPESFGLQPGERTRVRLHAGDQLKRERSLPFEARQVTRLQLIDANGARNLQPLLLRRALPALPLPGIAPGTALVAMDRPYAFITLEADAFRRYLAHEGIEGVRPAHGSRAVRERYARCMKALLHAGEEPSGKVYTRRIGQRLEITLLSNPYAMRSGDTLGVALTFDGSPLAGHGMAAYVEADSSVSTIALRTDASGRARFPLPPAGLVVVRALHLFPCVRCSDADWESWWASFSFAVGE